MDLVMVVRERYREVGSDKVVGVGVGLQHLNLRFGYDSLVLVVDDFSLINLVALVCCSCLKN